MKNPGLFVTSLALLTLGLACGPAQGGHDGGAVDAGASSAPPDSGVPDAGTRSEPDAGQPPEDAGVVDDGPYLFHFQATGFTNHAGKALEMIIHDTANPSRGMHTGVARLSYSPIPASGEFTLSSSNPVLEKGRSYKVSFFVDADANGYCDPPPFDKSWVRTIGPVSGEVTLEFAFNSTYQDVCSAFSP